MRVAGEEDDEDDDDDDKEDEWTDVEDELRDPGRTQSAPRARRPYPESTLLDAADASVSGHDTYCI